MPHPIGKKEESRAKILASAGRGFRAHGFGGLGIDGLAKAAGVTSGAFYAHFKSKADAFRESVQAGLMDLADGIAGFRAAGGDWVGAFIDFYMDDRRHTALETSCALQSLTGEVARADDATRRLYADELDRVIAELSHGFTGADARARAIAVLALVSGGVSMARATADPALADAIADAVRTAARRL